MWYKYNTHDEYGTVSHYNEMKSEGRFHVQWNVYFMRIKWTRDIKSSITLDQQKHTYIVNKGLYFQYKSDFV